MKSKQGKQNKMAHKKIKVPKASLPSEENDDLEKDLSTSEQEEMEVAKSATKDLGSTKKSNKKKQIMKEKMIQEGDSEEDDDEDEDSEDDDDEEDSDDADDSDEDDDDNDEDDDDSDKDGDDDEEEEDAKPGEKRKAKQPAKQENKKAKVETSKASGPGVKSLFFRMTSKDVESSTIEKFFDSHGVKVESVRRIGGRNFAYVDVNESQLEAALALSGKKMAGIQVQILPARDKSEKTQEKAPKPRFDADSKKRTLFVKNIGFDVKEDDIKAHFPLAQKVFAPHKMDGKLKGHAFLEFESEEVANKVMTELQNSTLCGRSLCLDYIGDKRQNTKVQSEPDESCKTLCVKQLNYKTTAEQLKAFFKKATEARIVKDTTTDKSKGFGFVVFESHEHASKALQNLQGKDLNGRNMVLSYALKKKSKPGKPKQDSESNKKSKKTFGKGSKNVKGGKPTKNRPTNKSKKTSNNKSKKAVEGDSS